MSPVEVTSVVTLALTELLDRAAVRVAARNAAALSAAEAGLVKAPREMCLVVHPDYGISCATRLPLEQALTRTASLASAWSAKLSRPPSGKLEGELITCTPVGTRHDI